MTNLERLIGRAPAEAAANGTRRHRASGLGWWWTFAAALVIGGAVIVAIVQNSHTVRLHYIVWQTSVPLIAVILATALVAVLLDQAGGLVWRRRRRATLARRDELAELRTQHELRSGAEGSEGPELLAAAIALPVPRPAPDL